MAVSFLYAMRRVNCPTCGVKVKQVPWANGKCYLTTSYRWFLATWAKRLSWSEVASIFQTSWDSVCRAVDHAVTWGLAHRDLSGDKHVNSDFGQSGRAHVVLRELVTECQRELSGDQGGVARIGGCLN